MAAITEDVAARALARLRESHSLAPSELADDELLTVSAAYGPDALAYLSFREIVAALNTELS